MVTVYVNRSYGHETKDGNKRSYINSVIEWYPISGRAATGATVSFVDSTNKTIDDDFSFSDDKYDLSDSTYTDFSNDDESDSCDSIFSGTSNCLLGFDSSDISVEPEWKPLSHNRPGRK